MAEPTAPREPALAGQTVVITGRDQGRLKQAAEQVRAGRAASFDADDGSALGRFFEQLDGPIGYVLLTAGGPYYAPFTDLDVAGAMRSISTHLAAPINVARYASPRMGPGAGR